jgi:chorismate dehydratase
MTQTLNVSRYVVGCVPYINARPLVRQFAETGEVEVIYDVPSKLPALLDAGKAEAVLASAFDAISTPGRAIAEGVSVGSQGAIESVRLFSKVPFPEISNLALDASSLTSNALALGILAEVYRAKPMITSALPDLEAMLKQSDAAVLIGDKGMSANGADLHVLDLGQAWTDLTSLPFVWAVWIGKEDLSPNLVGLLYSAARWGERQSELIAHESAETTGISLETCLHYLADVMDHRLTEKHLTGLRAYRDLLLKHGLLDVELFPKIVKATDVAAIST